MPLTESHSSGLLPRDSEWSQRRKKINLINYYLEKLCCDRFDDFYFMKQDDDWTDEDCKLDKKLYYAGQLHLVEAGNRIFACSIWEILSKLMQDEKLGNSSDERKAHYLFEFNSDVNRCKPVSHSKPIRPVSYSKSVHPVRSSKPVRPINHCKPVCPVYCKSLRPISHSNSACPIIYSKPICTVNHCKPIRAISHSKPVRPVNHSKPVHPVSLSKPIRPVSYSKPVRPIRILISFTSSFVVFLNKSVNKLNIFYLNILMNFHLTFLIFKKYFKYIYIFLIYFCFLKK